MGAVRLGGAARRRARPRRRFATSDRARPPRGFFLASLVAPLILARLGFACGTPADDRDRRRAAALGKHPAEASMRATRPVLLLISGLLLAGPAFAQGGGSGGGSSGGASGSTSGSGAAGQSGTQGSLPGQAGASSGPSGPGRRAQTEQQLQQGGAAPTPEQDARQLRDLNAISRQLGVGGSVPAPEVEGGGRR